MYTFLNLTSTTQTYGTVTVPPGPSGTSMTTAAVSALPKATLNLMLASATSYLLEIHYTDDTTGSTWVTLQWPGLTTSTLSSALGNPNGFQQLGTGSVLRTYQAKGQERVSPEDFGAKGDGTTNDTAAIDAAASWLSANGGGTLAFGPKNYAITQMKLYTGVIYQGAARVMGNIHASTTLSLIPGTNPTTGMIVKGSNKSTGWQLRNLIVEGNSASNTQGHGIYLYAVNDGIPINGDTTEDALIYEVVIRDTAQNGLHVSGDLGGYNIVQLNIDGLIVRYAGGIGVYAQSPTDGVWDRIIVSGCKMGGAYLSSFNNMQLHYMKGFYNGQSMTPGLNTFSITVTNSARGKWNIETQEEWVSGIAITNCSGFSANLLADANGYPGTTQQIGVMLSDVQNCMVDVVSDSYHYADATPFLQYSPLKIQSTTATVSGVTCRVAFQHQTLTSITTSFGTSVTQLVMMVNGYSQFWSQTANQLISRHDAAGVRYSQQRSFVNGDSTPGDNLQFDLIGDAAGSKWWDFMRNTNTASSQRGIRVFYGDGTSGVSHQLFGGSNGHALFAQSGGGWNSGNLGVGPYRFWVDSTANLRFKSGAPTSDQDGTAITGVLQPYTGAVYRTLPSKATDVINAADFGVVTGSTADQSALIQAAINGTPLNGVLEFNPGKYYCQNLTVSKCITIRGRTYGHWGPTTGLAPAAPVAVTFMMYASAANIMKVGGVANANPVEGIAFENVIFCGNNLTVTDALLAMEQTQSPYMHNCHFSYAVGTALRMRWVFEPHFSHCFWRSINAGAVNGMIILDSIYNANTNNNVNNVRFTNACHFEGNQGSYFYVDAAANADILQITNSKFEWGLSSIPGTGPWPLFNIKQCTRLDISHNSFTNYNPTNKYATILSAGELATSANCWGTMNSNQFSNSSTSTYIAQIFYASSLRVFNNINNSSNAQGQYLCTSTNAQHLEYWDSWWDGLGRNQTVAGSNLNAGFISSHSCSWNNLLFVPDANSLSIAGTVCSSAVTGNVLISLNKTRLVGNPTGYRVGIRARSATGVGTLDVLTSTGTTTFTLTASYATYFVNINAADVATVPGASYSVRAQVGSASTEAVFVDGAYVVPLSTAIAGMPDGYTQQTVANAATITVSVTAPANPNRRGLYMVVADTQYQGYCMIWHNGTSITPIFVGSDFSVGSSTNPATANCVNVYASGNSIAINNLYGSSRVITVFPFMGH